MRLLITVMCLDHVKLFGSREIVKSKEQLMSVTFQQILKFCVCDGQPVGAAFAKSWCYPDF